MAEPTHAPQPQLKYTPARNDSSSLLKIVVPVAVIGFLLLLVYTFLSGLRSAPKVATTTPSATPAVETTTTTTTSTTTQQGQLPLASGQKTQVAKAGMKTDVFSPYDLNLSTGWKEEHTADASIPSDKLVLTNGDYTLTISQAPSGGGTCIFPEDTPVEMSQSFKTYVGIPGIRGQFRRATNDNLNYTVCEKREGAYAFPTSFGHITYSVPTPADPKLLNEMDAMVASLDN